MNKPLTERYAAEIVGVLSCFDRIVIMGTLSEICHAGAMESLPRSQGVRLFDYTQVVEPWREEIRAHAERVAQEAGLEVEFIRRKNFRKEDRVQEILDQRGRQPGLVHIFSAMEPCSCFKPWHDKKTGRTSLRATEGKCLHYYFYFVDEDLGLCYLRVPTWAPFRLQFYCNGHNLLAARLRTAGIDFSLLDNAFVEIADFGAAQRLANDLRVDVLHRRLDRLARQYCPVVQALPGRLSLEPDADRIRHRHRVPLRRAAAPHLRGARTNRYPHGALSSLLSSSAGSSSSPLWPELLPHET